MHNFMRVILVECVTCVHDCVTNSRSKNIEAIYYK